MNDVWKIEKHFFLPTNTRERKRKRKRKRRMFLKGIEIINSLLFIFILTEIFRLNNYKQILLFFNYYLTSFLLFWLFLNLFLYYFNYIYSWLIINSNIFLIISPYLISIFDIIILTIIIGIIIISCHFFYLYFNNNNNNEFQWNKNQILSIKNIIFYIFCLIIVSFLLTSIGYNEIIQSSIFIRLYIIIISFTSILYLDISRLRSDVTFKRLFHCIYQSIGYSIAAIPILMILISFFFLILTTILEKLHTHPEDSIYLQNCIFYFTLYGPFYIIYWNTKKRYLQIPILPS